jgi:TRAP transporter TAXI family solute receptor
MGKNIRELFFGILITGILLTPLAGWGQGKPSGLPSALTMGTSSVGSTFYIMTVGMANLISKKTGINLSAEAVGGSDANVRALKDKKIDLAMLNANAIASGYFGVEQYAKLGKLPLRVLIQGQESLRYIVVRKASGIKSPTDLRGKKFIGKRRASVDVEMVANAMLKAYQLTKENVTIIETAETNEAIEALKTGAVDGAVIQAGVRASNLMELARDIDLVFLSFPDDKLQLMLQDLGPAFHKGVVPAGTYKDQSQLIQIPSLLTCIVGRSDFPEESAYTITKTLMDNQEALKAIHSVGKEWTMENSLKDPPAPFHSGAIKYYKEKGVWSPSLEKVQQQLLKSGGS